MIEHRLANPRETAACHAEPKPAVRVWQMEARGGVYCSKMLREDDQRHDRFLRLYSEHEPALRGFVRSLVPTRDDAREVMQEVTVVLWRKFGQLAAEEEFRRWAFGVARYEVLAWRRDKARDRHVFGDAALALLATEMTQRADTLDAQREALEECLQKLPAEQRALVHAAYADGARIDRLAAQSGRTAMALYKVLHRIRLALVECTRRVLAREGLA
ncbi:MAG: sigma-70 family RNA polymerase sigma factor [Opitutaceae bacterium]